MKPAVTDIKTGTSPPLHPKPDLALCFILGDTKIHPDEVEGQWAAVEVSQLLSNIRKRQDLHWNVSHRPLSNLSLCCDITAAVESRVALRSILLLEQTALPLAQSRAWRSSCRSPRSMAKSSDYMSLSPSFQRGLYSSWIKQNIRKKECCFFVEDESCCLNVRVRSLFADLGEAVERLKQGGDETALSGSNTSEHRVILQKALGFCKCGYPRIHHVEDAFKPDEFVGETWDRHKHMREVPTDAFGDISFGGLDTSTDDLYQVMIDHWKLHPPNLLISVTGGAQNFYMKTRLKEMFRRGLIKVAQTTGTPTQRPPLCPGAWILTGGTHTGVMKHVGQAVRDYALSSSCTENQIVAIGVATWGIVLNRQVLVNPEGCFPAYYSLDEKSQGRLSCLDDNHSHFLLVDDGTHGRYGVEIELRSKLEKLISELPLGNRANGVKIPVVCVVLDGGPGTLDTIYNAMLNGTPCVILEGSGRLADVIANVAELPVSRVTVALINQLMSKFFGQEFKELKVIEWTKKIQDIIRTPQLLTVFRIDEEGQNDVDVAILQALLKGIHRWGQGRGGGGWRGFINASSRNNNSQGRENWEQQLELAVAWNRVDIAKSEIFTEESQWQSGELHEAMLSALVGHKPDFVKLLLENGVCLREFLREDTLCELYTHLQPGCLFLRRLAKRMRGERGRRGQSNLSVRRKVSLHHVSDEVQHYLGSFTTPLYPPAPARPRIEMPKDDIQVTLPNKGPAELQNIPSIQSERGIGGAWDPERDLFLWAILQNSKELAEIAWEQCRDGVCAALAASKILKKMAHEEDEDDEVDKMQELANHYENQAIGVFSECYRQDEQRAQKLLIRISPSWGRTTCLRLALEADNKNFVAHAGVQGLLTQIWYGELAEDNPHWKMMLCMLFVPLIYTGLLSFRDYMECTELQPLTCTSRLVSFFSSPQVKFYWNIVSYFGFLWLFGYVLMMDFQAKPSWKEYLLYGWLISLVCEEIRQLFDDPDGYGFQRKSKMYISDLWNILDVLSILLFIIGLVCRLTTAVFYAGKVILCIDYIVFCLRLMAIFTISKTLGPKIIIVRRMMKDMFFFMFLLSIWVVAYGVAKQGILIQNEQRLDWIIRGVVYEPYLIIFGNVPTNIDNVEFDMSTCSVNGTDPLKPKCPVLNADAKPAFPEWLTIILLCVYLLFANILLLNLLIAIFNFTFQEVQDNTDSIWKFQRYELIKEYHSRPAPPPPFIFLSHLYLFIKRVVLRRPPQRHKQFKDELRQVEEEEMLSWEAFMKENYLAVTRRDWSQSMEHRIQDTADKVGVMVELLEGEQDRENVTLAKRMAHLEEQVSQSTKALQWIIEALKSQGYQSKEEPPVMSSGKAMERDKSKSKKKSVKKEIGFHINARHLQYPDSTVTRFPVPEEKVPWEVEFTCYNPQTYNAKKTPSVPEETEGYEGRCALEFLAVWDKKEGVWAIPGGPVHSEELLPQRLEAILGRKLHEQVKAKLEGQAEINKVHHGYVDDHRNTDNAWVETTAFNIHLDRRGLLMADINRMPHTVSLIITPLSSLSCTAENSKDSDERVQWQEVSSRTLVCAYQREVLRTVAELHGRPF
ncbi:hypothetical protein JZ751_027707 [Albula glossodonta]|uniref:Transient receptor potential cation channel subfamily M member 2 n=1 Tax=Albula glossodonta TaxID=121402 RepID=A0A8T2P9F8_9TELE|nr:hypothetical protein JZ751_027707 [Albula glossodonta]